MITAKIRAFVLQLWAATATVVLPQMPVPPSTSLLRNSSESTRPCPDRSLHAYRAMHLLLGERIFLSIAFGTSCFFPLLRVSLALLSTALLSFWKSRPLWAAITASIANRVCVLHIFLCELRGVPCADPLCT